ncbi:MAG TPA: hypothetical protein VMV77_16730 [Bacteroidales bacterium]|nr:hypothetical protein [Bacteroidales bacterium]
MEGLLLTTALDREKVREFCNLSCVPSLFGSLEIDEKTKEFKVSQRYIDGWERSEAKFKDIMSSPEKILRVVGSYTDFLNR